MYESTKLTNFLLALKIMCVYGNHAHTVDNLLI